MQREDSIIEWIFLGHKQNKKLKTYIEKFPELNIKSRVRLCQLSGTDLTELVESLTWAEICHYGWSGWLTKWL